MSIDNNVAVNAKTSGRFKLVCLILDRSGSMERLCESVLEGTNDFIKECKETDAKGNLSTKYSYYSFSSSVEKKFLKVSTKDVKPLIPEDYIIGGMTALNDAIGIALDDTKEETNVLFFVFTDGMENSSSEYNDEQVSNMIKDAENNRKCKFVFMGCDKTVIGQTQSLGIKRNDAYEYTPTKNGVKSALRSLSTAVRESQKANCALNIKLDNDST